MEEENNLVTIVEKGEWPRYYGGEEGEGEDEKEERWLSYYRGEGE
jgi:hypothetical protein